MGNGLKQFRMLQNPIIIISLYVDIGMRLNFVDIKRANFRIQIL
jgi:hypothetical protein